MKIRIFVSASGTPKWLVHTLSSIIGLGLLISFFNTNIIFQIGLTLSAWIMLQISHKIGHGCRGLLSLILCVSFNLICELFFATPVDWQSIRGMAVINRVMHKKQLKASFTRLTIGYGKTSLHIIHQNLFIMISVYL